MAQYERALIKERVIAELEAAKRRGKRGGRPRVIDEEKMEAIIKQVKDGVSKASICRTFGIKSSTLYDALTNRLSDEAKDHINSKEVYISAIVRLELQYLYEIGRIADSGDTILNSLNESIGLRIINSEFNKIIESSLSISWTRDPFDRIITAEALYHKCVLITADKNIKKNLKLAVC